MIRPATAADTEELVRIAEATGVFKPVEIAALREVLDDYYADKDDDHHAVVCEEAGVVLGFAYYALAPMTDRTWELWWIAVRKERQARGVGSNLLHYVESEVRGRAGRVLFIETGSPPPYERTRAFYRKHGYEQHAILADFYGVDDSMVVFRKSLEQPAQPA